MAHIWFGPVVLRWYSLARSQLHLRRLHQALFAQDAVDRGLRDAEALVVGDPGSQLSAAQLRHLPGCLQNVVNFLETKTVPRGLTASWMVLKSLMVLASEPPVVSALWDAHLSEDPSLGERR